MVTTAIAAVFQMLVDTAARGTVLLMTAFMVTSMNHRWSAAIKHRIWSLTMFSLLLLPAVAWLLPSWQLPIWPANPQTSRAQILPEVRQNEPEVHKNEQVLLANESLFESVTDVTLHGEERSEFHRLESPIPSADVFPPPSETRSTSVISRGLWWRIGTVAIWFFGTAIGLSGLFWGILHAQSFARRSRVLSANPWPTLVDEMRDRLGLARYVELREADQSIVPQTWGLLRPMIVLPWQAQSWTDKMRRAVLLHELAHVQRFDVAHQLLGRVACCLYWYHPLVWIGLRCLRWEREQACDDAVVRSGQLASDYAHQLLAVAQIYRPSTRPSLAIEMTGGGGLEQRIRALFDSGRGHRPIDRSAAAAVMFIAAVVLCGISTVKPIEREFRRAIAAEASNSNQSADREADASVELTPDEIRIATSQLGPSIVKLMPPGKGMGTVIDDSGHILVAYHNVARVNSILVAINEAVNVEARLVAVDAAADLALIKIDRNLPAAPLARSSDLKVGDRVIAIHRTGEKTSGRVTVLNQQINVNESLTYRFIETNVGLVPGDSGSPLLNTNGDVIGIGIALPSKQRGFAIPIDDVRKTISQLLDSVAETDESDGPVSDPQNKNTLAALQADQPVSSVCMDANGKPVAGAEVYIFQYSGFAKRYREFGPILSDAEGKATFELSLFSDNHGNYDHWFLARVPGRLVGTARSVKWTNWDPINAKGEVRLYPSHSVEGTVTVPEGFDVTKVFVRTKTLWFSDDGANSHAQCFSREETFRGLHTALPQLFDCHPDSEGRFRINDIPKRGSLYLVTVADGLAEAQWRNANNVTDQRAHLALSKESRLSGQVLKHDGQPAANAKVFARLEGYPREEVFYLSTFTAVTDPRGNFVIDKLPQTRFCLSITDPQGQFRFRPIENLNLAANENRHVTLQTDAAVRVSGKVVDSDGNPVEGAAIAALADTLEGPGLDHGRTDKSGHYEFRLPAGKARLYFSGLPSRYVYPDPQTLKKLDIQLDQDEIQNLNFTVEIKPIENREPAELR